MKKEAINLALVSNTRRWPHWLHQSDLSYITRREMMLGIEDAIRASPLTGISSIRITDAARMIDGTTGEEAMIVSIWCSENGTIRARYSNGEVRDICQQAIVDFKRPRDLKRSGQHLFEYEDNNFPRDSDFYRVYGTAIEVLDEDAYMSMGFPRWEA